MNKLTVSDKTQLECALKELEEIQKWLTFFKNTGNPKLQREYLDLIQGNSELAWGWINRVLDRKKLGEPSNKEN